MSHDKIYYSKHTYFCQHFYLIFFIILKNIIQPSQMQALLIVILNKYAYHFYILNKRYQILFILILTNIFFLYNFFPYFTFLFLVYLIIIF